MEYRPTGPYLYKKGRSMGQWMLENYSFLLEEWENIQKENREITQEGRHMDWILKRGEDCQPVKTCPYCNKRKVVFFSLHYCFSSNKLSIDYLKSSCANDYCKRKMRESVGGMNIKLLRPKWSKLETVVQKKDQKEVIKLYKDIFQLPEKITKEEAFHFFSQRKKVKQLTAK